MHDGGCEHRRTHMFDVSVPPPRRGNQTQGKTSWSIDIPNMAAVVATARRCNHRKTMSFVISQNVPTCICILLCFCSEQKLFNGIYAISRITGKFFIYTHLSNDACLCAGVLSLLVRNFTKTPYMDLITDGVMAIKYILGNTCMMWVVMESITYKSNISQSSSH